MILDAQNQFSSAQSLASGTDSGVLATNVYDLGVAGRDVAVGEPMYLLVVVTTAFEGSGDTLDVEVVSDSVSTLDSSLTVHQVVGTIPAESAAGTVLIRPLPPATVAAPYERYLGVRYFARGSGPLTAGAVSTYLVKDPQLFKAYADNVTIT